MRTTDRQSNVLKKVRSKQTKDQENVVKEMENKIKVTRGKGKEKNLNFETKPTNAIDRETKAKGKKVRASEQDLEIGQRIKLIREHYDMTQKAFCEELGRTRTNLAGVEVGYQNVTDRLIMDICEKFAVDTNWLVTGEGHMFTKETSEEIILRRVTDILASKNRFRRIILASLMNMNDQGWEELEKELTDGMNKYV